MNKILRQFIYLVIVLLCVGCKSSNNANESNKKVEFDKLVNDVFDDYSKEVGLPLFDVLDQDLDDDGLKEHIAFFGEEGYLQAALCVREEGEELEVIDFELDAKGYMFQEARVVKLENSEKNFIQLIVSNGVSFQGVALYELEGKKIENIFYQADPMAREDATLSDSDENGKFEVVSTTKHFYDTQEHEIHYTYTWDGKEFLAEELLLTYGNDSGEFKQPAIPEDLVFGYFEGYFVDQNYIAIPEEMKGMVQNSEVLDVKVEGIFDELDYQSMDYGNLDTILEIEILQMNESSVKVQAIGSQGSLVFELVFDKTWLIAEIHEETAEDLPTFEQSDAETIILSEDILTEDNSQYTLELTSLDSSNQGYYDNITIFKEINGVKESVFDFQEQGLNILGNKRPQADIYYNYEDLDNDGSKELYFSDSLTASNFTKKLIIGYFDQKFQVMFYDEIYEISYQDLDVDGINELVGTTIPGGQVSYDIGFLEAFKRIDNRYYHQLGYTKMFGVKKQEDAENLFIQDDSLKNLNQLICYCAYNGDEKRIEELLTQYEEIIAPIVEGYEFNEDTLYILSYAQMIEDYRERWKLIEMKDNEMGIVLEDY